MFLNVVQSFTIKDLVDILIVAGLIYAAIKLVRETRAGQLVKGLMLFIVVFVASSVFDLTMLNTLLKYFFQYAFIAILIIFQPEIRKALEQMGRNSVGKSLVNVVAIKDTSEREAEVKKSIDNLVDAFVILKNLKMGALVVFERETKLGEIIETGTIVDAKASTKMIANIFFNKAPLHDGAVVMRDGRLLSAGCILPLTKNDSIDESVGTRHRAALGISEESDSVTVILSEETGQFSIAVDGKLTRNYSKETLVTALVEYLLPKEKEEVKVHEAKKRSIFVRRKGVQDEDK